MSSSTPHLTQISPAQIDKEAAINALFDACSPAAIFGRRPADGLTWAYYGGTLYINGAPTAIANGQLTLTDASTCYVEAARDGVVTHNTAGWTAGRLPLYTVTTAGGQVRAWSDVRVLSRLTTQTRTVAMPDAAHALTPAEAACEVLLFTGALTAPRDVVVPSMPAQLVVNNSTSHTLTVKSAVGASVAVTAGTRALVACDGTDVIKAGSSEAAEGSAATFLALTDTPDSYAGQSGRVVVVNGASDGLEFRPPQHLQVLGPESASFTLSNANAGCFVPVNASATITCASDSTIAHGVLWRVFKSGTGAVGYAAGAGVTLRFRTGLTGTMSGQYSVVTITKLSDTLYVIDGDLA